MRRARIVFFLLVIAQAAPAQIKIGICGTFTGGSAKSGLSMRNGVELAVEQINAAGGILGQMVQLVERDDEGKAENGPVVMRDLIDQQRVSAVLGGVVAAATNAENAYANENRVPVIVNSSTGAEVNEYFARSGGGNYVFRVAVADRLASQSIVREAVVNRKAKAPALLHDESDYGRNGARHVLQALRKYGVKPKYVGRFKAKDADMTAQLREARSAGADILLVYGVGPELAAISNSTQRLGWKIDMIGSWTLAGAAYLTGAGKNAEGTTMPLTFIESAARTTIQREFVAAYQSRFDEKPIQMASAAAQGYDSLYLLKMAIEQAKSTEGPSIKAALEDLAGHYDGVLGKYIKPFSATDHEAVKEGRIMMGRVKNGTVVPSWDY